MKKSAFLILNAHIIGFLGFLFHFRFSLRPLNPSDVSWLLNGDMAGPFLGWLHFLHEEWHWPLGSLLQPMPSVQQSLSLMDAIPLASFLVKTLGFQEGLWQFHGYWFLSCYILQAYFAQKLIFLFRQETLICLFGACFMTLSPILLSRTGHISLCAHWIVLFCLYENLKTEKSHLKTVIAWSFLSLCALGIHPYFVLFTLTFALFSCVRYLWDQHQRIVLKNHVVAFLNFSVIFICTLCFAYMLGLLDREARRELVGGLHFYTADVFMFLNSGGLAFFGPELWSFKMGQYEAFSYLGFGAILLLALYTIDCWGHHKKMWKTSLKSEQIGPCLAAIGLLTFFALGSQVRFFGKWILDFRFLYEPFYPILSSFRANGRFIWAAFYGVMLWIVLYKPKNIYLQRYRSFLFIIALVFQIIDLSQLSHVLHEEKILKESDLFGDFALKGIKDIAIVPPETNDDDCEGYTSSRLYIPFNMYAATHHMKINSSYRAHLPDGEFQNLCYTAIDQMESKNLQEGTLYVVRKPFSEILDKTFLHDFCQDRSRYYLCRKIK